MVLLRPGKNRCVRKCPHGAEVAQPKQSDCSDDNDSQCTEIPVIPNPMRSRDTGSAVGTVLDRIDHLDGNVREDLQRASRRRSQRLLNYRIQLPGKAKKNETAASDLVNEIRRRVIHLAAA